MASKSSVFPRWLLVVAGLLFVGWLFYLLRGVLTPIFLGFLIAYMLDPVVDWFEARKMPRAFGIAVMLTLVLGASVIFVVIALPRVIEDVSGFVSELPQTVRNIAETVEPILQRVGIEIPRSVGDALSQAHLDTEQLISKAAKPASAVASWVLGGTASMVGALTSAFLVPIYSAYLLNDFDRITAGIRDLVPEQWRPFVVDVAREVDEVLGEFIRGQLIVMLVLAVLYSVSYSLLGVRLAVLIGLVGGLLSFIPYVGGAVALGFAVIMVLLDWSGWAQLVGVVAAYSAIQVLEGFVITPRVVGDKVGLSAIWVLFALMVGSELFGFMGVLLALPTAAVIKIFVVRVLAWYRRSDFFNGREPSASESGLGALLHEEGLPDNEAVAAAKQRTEPEPQSQGLATDPSADEKIRD